MIRTIAAVVAGLVVAMSLVTVAEMLGMRMYPPPPGLDPNNAAQMKEIARLMPMGALVMVLAGWTIGALGGSAIAVLIDRRKPLAGWITGALFVAVTIWELVVIPGPNWFRVAAIILELAAIAAAVRSLAIKAPRPTPIAQD